MKTIRYMTSIAAVLAVLVLTVAAGPGDTKATAKIGAAAPDFKLTDVSGKTHTLADYKGKTVVLEWFNPGCPWCQKVYNDGAVQDTLATMKKMGEDYVYIAVNSTANLPKDVVEKQSTTFLASNKVEIPVLIDYDGAVGHAYGAKTTPHMFIIDGEGVLRYSGAFASDRKDVKGSNLVVVALKQIAAGETVTPDQTRPWGCGVKYSRKK